MFPIGCSSPKGSLHTCVSVLDVENHCTVTPPRSLPVLHSQPQCPEAEQPGRGPCLSLFDSPYPVQAWRSFSAVFSALSWFTLWCFVLKGPLVSHRHAYTGHLLYPLALASTSIQVLPVFTCLYSWDSFCRPGWP